AGVSPHGGSAAGAGAALSSGAALGGARHGGCPGGPLGLLRAAGAALEGTLGYRLVPVAMPPWLHFRPPAVPLHASLAAWTKAGRAKGKCVARPSPPRGIPPWAPQPWKPDSSNDEPSFSWPGSTGFWAEPARSSPVGSSEPSSPLSCRSCWRATF